MNEKAITQLVLKRQYFNQKAGIKEYESLFRRMQPVQTVYWCCPGDPPVLVHRAGFDDREFNMERRSDRTLIKGRFQNGTIAYVCADELELYAAAYKKMYRPSYDQQLILELLEREGPMTIRVMKEMTGMPVKQITPALHKLQEAFLVFEDQVDCEGDRGWYIFEKEFPGVKLDRISREAAIRELILRFLYLNVFADTDMLRSFYCLPSREIGAAVRQLELDNIVKSVEVEGKKGIILAEDRNVLENSPEDTPCPSVFVLHRNDYLVKANEHWLKEKFQSSEYEILQYILIDGHINGAVLGKFRNGPYNIEDIVLTLSDEESDRRKGEIIQAVYQVNNPEHSPIRRFCGRLV